MSKYYYLNEEYTPGRAESGLRDRLAAVPAAEPCFVGLDVGHGETCATFLYKNAAGSWETAPLYFDGNERVVASMISYGNGVKTGRSARANGIKEFKIKPACWDNNITNNKTYGEVLKDFIAEVWKELLRANSTNSPFITAAKSGSLVLCAGCPSSPDWTEHMEDYAGLLREATGCGHIVIQPESNAAVMDAVCGHIVIQPESNAAVMDAVCSKSEQAAGLTRGVAIFDAGSSTIDFTYILPGVILITGSIGVAGSDIDHAVCRRALAAGGKDGQPVLPESEADVRFEKEEFYNAQGATGGTWKSITLADGTAVNYRLSGGFMDEALGMALPGFPNEPGLRGMSWSEAVGGFVSDMLRRVKQSGHGCGSVILTGGTSKVTQFQNIVRKRYKKAFGQSPCLILSENPSASVSSGLCSIALRESEAFSALNDMKASARAAAKTLCDEMLKSAAEEIVRRSTSRAVGAMQAAEFNDKAWTLKQLAEAGRNSYRFDAKRAAECAGLVNDAFRTALKSCRGGLVESFNALADRLYGESLSAGDLGISGLDISFPDYDFKSYDFQGEIYEKIFSDGWLTAYGVIGGLAGFFGLTRIEKWAKSRRESYDRPLDDGLCGRIYGQFNDIGNFGGSIAAIEADLRAKTDIAARFEAAAEELFDVALGKTLLLIYNERGDGAKEAEA